MVYIALSCMSAVVLRSVLSWNNEVDDWIRLILLLDGCVPPQYVENVTARQYCVTSSGSSSGVGGDDDGGGTTVYF